MSKWLVSIVVGAWALAIPGCGETSSNETGPGGDGQESSAAVEALSPGAQSAGAVVLVNTASANFPDFVERVQPYLDHFGIPYEVHDIATQAVTDTDLHRALIIIGHDRLDESLSFLDAAEQAEIVSAVASGAGLVNFDTVLAGAGNNPIYTYAQDLLPATYGANGSAGSIQIQSAPLHFIVDRHDPSEVVDLKSNMTVLGMTPPGDAEVVATAGSRPLITARTHGQGRVVQWGSYGWISNDVKGPVYGLDDLVWRSMVWAARKPFVMQGMPPFLPMRVDDVDGRGLDGGQPLEWLHIAIDEFGYKPWVGVFSREIDAEEGAMLSARAHAGEATVSVHSFRTHEYLYLDHFTTWGDWPDSVMADHIAEGTQFHLDHDIPISTVVVPHLYEIGTNAFAGLGDWGVEFIETQMKPGELYGANGLTLGPYRLFETENSDAVEPMYYADFIDIPGHPELDGQFFNCVTEIRDDAGYEWFPSADISRTIDRGTRQSKRAFDSMVLATLFTHEYHLGFIQPENWRAALAGIATNLAPYQPIYVTLDEACQYVRAVATSSIAQSEFDPVTGDLETTFSGSADIDTQFFLFTQDDQEITETRIDVPAFVGSVLVSTSISGPCIGDCPATVTLSGLSQVYDGTPRTVTATTTPSGLPVLVTYDGSPTPPVEVGSYAVVATVSDPNYAGSTSGTLVVSADAFPATVLLSGLNQAFDGTPRAVTATTTPSGLAVVVTYDGSPTPPVDAGSYAVVATVDDLSYVGSTAGTLVVDTATATITLGDLNQVYDGTPRAVTVTTSPPGLPVTLTYDGGATAPVELGSYAVDAAVSDPNYSGSAGGTLVVSAEGGGGPNFCDTAPASTAQFCDDFEAGLPCTDPLRVPRYTSQLDAIIDCASPTNPIDGGYSLELITATSNDQLHCDDEGGLGCFGPALTGVTCTRLSVRVDDDGTSNSAQDLFVPRSAGDSENLGLQIDPSNAAAAVDMDVVVQPDGSRLQNAMTNGAAKIWCLEQDFDGFQNAIYSGSDCGADEVVPLGWNWESDHGGFRIRAYLDNADVLIDNVTVHQGSCEEIWGDIATSATVTLSGLSQEYNGSPRIVTATTVPAGLPVTLTYDGSPTPPVEVGSYAVVATISDPNYSGSATGTLIVAPQVLPATVTLSGLSQVYAGTPRTVTATTTPVGLPVTLTYNGGPTPPVGVGSYAVVATVNHPSYAGSAAGTLAVTPAPAIVTLGGLNQVYDGSARAVTASTTPAGLALTLTYDGSPTPPAEVGSYAVVATVSDSNYSGSAAGTLVVTPAVTTVTLSGLSQVYDGSPRVVTGTTTPLGLSVAVTYDGDPIPPTDTGSYAIVATINDASYTGSATGTLVVAPGVATVTLSGLSQVHDGSPRVVTATTIPLGLQVAITYDGDPIPPTEVGSYAVVGLVTDANYGGSSAGTLVVSGGVLPATVTLAGLNQVYDGSPRAVAVTTIPSSLSVAITYDGAPTPPVGVGSYAVVATVTHAGYVGSAAGTLVVSPGVAIVDLSALNQVYDGSARVVAATTIPPGLPVAVTYDGDPIPPVDVGSYAVVATVTFPGYLGSAAGTLVVTPAVATVELGGLNQVYDGGPRVAGVTTVPPGLSVAVTYDGAPAPPVDVGSYAVVATLTDPGYTGSAAGILGVTPASATVTLSGLNQIYDGSPRVVTATTAPAGLPVSLTYDGASAPPVSVGSYSVLATVSDPNYTGLAAGTLVVDPDTGGGPKVCDTAPGNAAQFCDDFDGSTLGAGWAFTDRFAIAYPTQTVDHVTLAMTGDAVSMSFPGGIEHNQWWVEHAQVTRPFLGAGVYETRMNTGLTGNQQFGMVFQGADPGTFMMFMMYGNGVIHGYMERFSYVDGVQHRQTFFPVLEPETTLPDAGPYYLRVTVSDEIDPSQRVWRWEWSVDGVTWNLEFDGVLEGAAADQNIGAITDVGMFVGNHPTGHTAFDGRYDYFLYNSLPDVPPPSPFNLLAVPADGSVQLSWGAVGGVDEYRIYRDEGNGQSLLATTTSPTYLDTNVINDTEYTYFVTAVAGALESLPAVAVATPTAGPLTATVTLGGLTQVYDGTPRVVTATTTPPGLPVSLTYDGGGTAPINVGSYEVVATVSDPNYTGSAAGTLVVAPDTGGGSDFCDTAPANTAQFCDDFEGGLACADPARSPSYTSQVGSSIDCASALDPIDGSHSLGFSTGTANDQLHCDDGNGVGCFGPALTGVSCTRFAVRIDNDGTSVSPQDLFVPRSSEDAENLALQVDPRNAAAALDMDVVFQPDGARRSDAMTNGETRIWCLQQDFDSFQNNVYSGGDCGNNEVVPLSWNWESDHGGFRIRAFLDNAQVRIDNITVHQGACQDIW